jgi:hypothetical protein
MPDIRETQLRFIYSLLKPAVRAAARFRLPIKTLVELVRLAYFEHLARQGLSTAEIATRLGQTTRHMQSLARRLETDFFRAERGAGLVREVEAFVAAGEPSDAETLAQFSSWPVTDVTAAIALLVREERIERTDAGRLRTAQRYVVMRTDEFHHRIDSLNHFLDGTYRAVLHRLLFDNQTTAMMKTISFSALPDDLVRLLRRIEAELRVELGAMDERATFAGQADSRFTLVLASAPVADP